VTTNNSTESPEEFFPFNFGYDIVKDSEQIIQQEIPEWKLPEIFIGKKAAELEMEKTDANVSVRSIFPDVESLKLTSG
jgi:hypothetical protein